MSTNGDHVFIHNRFLECLYNEESTIKYSTSSRSMILKIYDSKWHHLEFQKCLPEKIFWNKSLDYGPLQLRLWSKSMFLMNNETTKALLPVSNVRRAFKDLLAPHCSSQPIYCEVISEWLMVKPCSFLWASQQTSEEWKSRATAPEWPYGDHVRVMVNTIGRTISGMSIQVGQSMDY